MSSEIFQKQVAAFTNIPTKKAESVLGWGKTLIAAPHPDDESLGCGGAIALLRKYGRDVSILTISDGTLSHPNSTKFPPAKLRDLRETEMIAAGEILGVMASEIKFLRFLDRSVPPESSENFAAAVEAVGEFLARNQPQTILLPWRRDPHPDHQATWQIFNRAADLMNRKFRFLEYPIWLWEMANAANLPGAGETQIWRLEIDEVIEQKQRAIRAHASQITDLIDDDPAGFRLSKEVLEHFAEPFEIYLETI